MELKSVEDIFKAFSTKTVLVIGDVMIDSYIHGGAKKNSPDASVPIINVEKREMRLGGAANVAMNIQALGATPILCSVVGDDREGQTFERLLESQGLPRKGIIRSQTRITTNKLRILSESQLLLRLDTEDVHPLEDLDRKSLLNHIVNLSKESDLIIFEDYDQGAVHSEIISETIKMAHELNIPIAVDPRQKNFLSYQGTTLFKPNISEIESFNDEKLDLRLPSNLRKVVGKLHEKVNAMNYLISLDSGDVYYHSQGDGHIYPAKSGDQVDMAGVGNAIVSIAALGLSIGLKSEAIGELSKIGADIVAAHSGVVSITRDQLMKEASVSQILKKYF